MSAGLVAGTQGVPRVGLMLGDMTGIGPEVCSKLLASGRLDEVCDVVVVGDRRVLELGCRDAGVAMPDVAFVDLRNVDPAAIARGAVSPESGRLTGETLQHMTHMALGGELDAICFAPLNKAALHQGGWKYHDEHQMFAAFTQHEGFFGEMNVIEQFATFRVTSHVALRQALEMIAPQRIADAIRLADTTLRANGIAQPRIGVAALNPHCGENGLFGDEEIRIIRPTVDRLRGQGVQCTGPVSSDVIFLKALRGEFDGVVTMYHDQGQIATKLLGFSKGVTVTAGLKTVYTTPAHGTAFDIVGQGKADPSALEQAVRIAARLAAASRARLPRPPRAGGDPGLPARP